MGSGVIQCFKLTCKHRSPVFSLNNLPGDIPGVTPVRAETNEDGMMENPEEGRQHEEEEELPSAMAAAQHGIKVESGGSKVEESGEVIKIKKRSLIKLPNNVGLHFCVSGEVETVCGTATVFTHGGNLVPRSLVLVSVTATVFTHH